MMAPSLDPLEARQLLSASPLHSHAERLHHHHAAVVENARQAHNAPTRISAAASTPTTSTSFSVVPSPQNPGQLFATAAIADNDIWAVGANIITTSPTAPAPPPLVEHFNGTSWNVIPTPVLSSGGANPPDAAFFGVAAAASNDVWAVGYRDDPINTANSGQLIEHWNGTSWRVNTTGPEIPGDVLHSVTVVSSNNVWAVGNATSNGLIEHWDGTAWSIVSNSVIAGAGQLSSISADSANDVWAVGNRVAAILHFNGTTWSRVASPSLDANSVTALSPTNVWAVGTVEVFFNRRFHQKAAIEHWDGTSWSIVSNPNPTSSPGLDSSLNGIAAISANDIWAVGTFHTSTGSPATLIEHWDGTSWTIISSPNPGTASSSLFAVTTLSDGTVVAVGSQTNQNSTATPLILQN
jgi:hypothetical protein